MSWWYKFPVEYRCILVSVDQSLRRLVDRMRALFEEDVS